MNEIFKVNFRDLLPFCYGSSCLSHDFHSNLEQLVFEQIPMSFLYICSGAQHTSTDDLLNQLNRFSKTGTQLLIKISNYLRGKIWNDFWIQQNFLSWVALV